MQNFNFKLHTANLRPEFNLIPAVTPSKPSKQRTLKIDRLSVRPAPAVGRVVPSVRFAVIDPAGDKRGRRASGRVTSKIVFARNWLIVTFHEITLVNRTSRSLSRSSLREIVHMPVARNFSSGELS